MSFWTGHIIARVKGDEHLRSNSLGDVLQKRRIGRVRSGTDSARHNNFNEISEHNLQFCRPNTSSLSYHSAPQPLKSLKFNSFIIPKILNHKNPDNETQLSGNWPLSPLPGSWNSPSDSHRSSTASALQVYCSFFQENILGWGFLM